MSKIKRIVEIEKDSYDFIRDMVLDTNIMSRPRCGATTATTVYELMCCLKESKPYKEGLWRDYSSEGYLECPFCESATNCDDNKDELHFCWSCGAELR